MNRNFRPVEVGFVGFPREDLLLDLSFIRLISLSGYNLRSQGRDTIRQALMIVTEDSSTVQIADGTM